MSELITILSKIYIILGYAILPGLFYYTYQYLIAVINKNKTHGNRSNPSKTGRNT
jgi:hypothetical protein